MAISTPQLVSCSARFEESVLIRSSTTSIIFAFKSHKGSPLREVEVYRLNDVQDALSGPFFFNVVPVRIEILQQPFRFVSILVLSTQDEITAGDDVIIRFYYNDGGGRNSGENTVYHVDYNVDLNVQVGPVKTVSFEGIDPFIMDARTIIKKQRLYMAYVTPGGQQALRVSEDLGLTWSKGCFFDSDVRWVEAYIRDPEGIKELIRAMQMQSGQTVLNPIGDVFLNDFSTTPVVTRLIQKIYPINRRPPRKVDGKDTQRFRELSPLVIRTPPVKDPC